MKYFSLHKTDHPGKTGWYLGDPSSFHQDGYDEILSAVQNRGTDRCRLAVAYTFSYLQFPAENVITAIENMLTLAEKNDIPAILHLDGVNWWTTRPDLWNFWDSSLAGYHPENILNVERYGWEPGKAVKIGWRNWGRQIRVAPAPNLASPAFLAAQTEVLSKIFPVIAEWYHRLAKDKKYLLGGIVLGWELSTYVQAYYYPGGNEMLHKPAADDPQDGLESSLPLGYAAAQTLGIQTEGVITEETEDKICSFYLNFLIETAVKYGISPSNIITHSFYGGKTKYGGGQSGVASISGVDGVIPGWSWYDSDFTNIDKIVSQLNGGEWAAIEVKPWDLSLETFKSLFAYKNCRYINIYNWESIRDNAEILTAIRQCLEKGAINIT